MKILILDGKIQTNSSLIYDFFAKEFDFGPYFRRNPDALYDFMIPIDDEDRPLIIEWNNYNVFKEKNPTDFEIFLSVFDRISDFEKNDKTIFELKLLGND